MCTFITATLPAGADLTALQPLLKAHQRAFHPVDNPWVVAQLPGQSGYFRASNGWCDCDTALGHNVLWSRARRNTDREERRRRRQGWTEARIERWRSERDAAAERHEQARAAEYDRDLLRWLAFLGEMLGEGRVGEMGILLHFYSGTLEDERIHITDVRRVPAGQVTAATLADMEADVLYVFHR